MKYLKYINENWQVKYANEETDNLVLSIQDICLELEDEGYHVQVNKMLPNSDKIMIYVKWKIYNKRPDVILLNQVMSRIKDMMKGAGWFLGTEEDDLDQTSFSPIDKHITFTKEKEKEYVTFGDGTAHTNF